MYLIPKITISINLFLAAEIGKFVVCLFIYIQIVKGLFPL